MNVCLKAAVPEDKEPLRNLLEKYLYEFSEWEGQDVDCNGLYGYPYLDAYWTDEKRYPFLILVDGKLAGFAMVNCGYGGGLYHGGVFCDAKIPEARSGAAGGVSAVRPFPGQVAAEVLSGK